jgi:O-antigen/teichoic acid export membrane protein
MQNSTDLNKNFRGISIAKNSILNLLGYIVPIVFAVALIPSVIKGLGQERFGILSLIWVVIGYFSFFDFGVGRALTKIVAEKIGTINEEEIPRLFWTSLYLLLFISLILTIASYFLTPFLVHNVLSISTPLENESLKSFYLLALSLPIIVTTAGIRGFLEAYHKFGVINVIRIILGINTFLIPIVCLFFTSDLFWIVLFMFLLRIIVWVLYFYQCLIVNKSLNHPYRFEATLVRKIFKLSGWMALSNFLSPLIVHSDRFLIGALVSASAIAYYTTPYEIVLKFLVIPGALAGVLFPTISANSQSNPELVKKVILKAIKYLIIILIPFCLVFLVFANEGLSIWLGKEFASQSTFIVQIFAIGLMFNGIAYIPYYFLEGMGRPDITAKLQMTEFPLYLILMFYLISNYGINGAAVAWLIRIIIDFYILLYIAQNKIFFPIKSLLKLRYLVFLLIIFYPILILLVNDFNFKIIGFAVFLIFFIYFVWKYLLSIEEKSVLFSLLQRRNFNSIVS